MTYSKLPGVYFSEEVLSSVVDSSTEYAPLFLVQASTSIAQIDDKVTYFESIDAFKTIAENKGLAKSIVAIEQILNEYQSQRFYVCNIHTDTSASITSILKDSADKKDIQDIIYIEETKSGQSNSLNAKIKAIESSVVNNSQNCNHPPLRNCSRCSRKQRRQRFNIHRSYQHSFFCLYWREKW